MESKNKPRIPLALLHEDAENKIFNAVNESAKVNKIPFFLLEGILTNILHQVREQAKVERENATRAYEKQMEEYNKEQAEEEGKECKKQ